MLELRIHVRGGTHVVTHGHRRAGKLSESIHAHTLNHLSMCLEVHNHATHCTKAIQKAIVATRAAKQYLWIRSSDQVSAGRNLPLVYFADARGL
jgi:hypothetical protein